MKITHFLRVNNNNKHCIETVIAKDFSLNWLKIGYYIERVKSLITRRLARYQSEILCFAVFCWGFSTVGGFL